MRVNDKRAMFAVFFYLIGVYHFFYTGSALFSWFFLIIALILTIQFIRYER